MRRASALTLVLLLLGVAGPGRAEVSGVAVHVDGLACPFCVFGIEKKLLEVPGVQSASTDLERGRVRLDLTDGSVPDVGAIEKAIEKAGFTPRDVTLTAVGTLAREDDRLVLAVRGTDVRYLLFESDGNGGDFSSETRADLEKKVEAGTVVAVTGRVHEHAGGTPGLSIDRIEDVHEVSLEIEGMSCARCAARLARLLGQAPGVSHAAVDFDTRRATISGTRLDSSRLISVVGDAGFSATQRGREPRSP